MCVWYNRPVPKQISLKEAAKLIPSWSSVFIGGFAHIRAGMSFSRELIRQGTHDLHFVSSGPTVHTDLLAGGNVVSRMEVAYGGIETIGPGPNIRRRVEQGDLLIEDYTNLSMTMRLYGGAIGVPFMPVKSILGSDIETKTTFRRKAEKLALVECPFTGELVCLVPSINPDFGVIQVQRVDTEGNVQIDDALTSDVDGLKASDVKIVLAEEIVSPTVTRRDPKKTAVPGLMVDYIVHAPWGAWPTAMYNFYDYDQEHIEYYADLCKTEEGWDEYKKEWVDIGEEALMKKIADRREKLKARKGLGY